MKDFKELNLSPAILQAIDEMGFQTPTEVQSRAIPHILDGKDLIVMSKTGSGKTAVFGISMLQMMKEAHSREPQGLILTPTRELAVQVDSDLVSMAKYVPHQTTAVYGQHNMNTEIQLLKKGVSIVTGTPGRVQDHIRQGNLKTGSIGFLVIDEADRMLDMGFIGQVENIIKTLPSERITLLFSATIPTEVRKICRKYMKDPVIVEIESPTKTVSEIKQIYYRVERSDKLNQLHRILRIQRPESCIIFSNTRAGTDRVQSFLMRKGYGAQALHGDIPQSKRTQTIQRFKQGEFPLLVATDVAARGIHVEELSMVINFDVPDEKDSYIHRIGRTGRAGHTGYAVSFVTGNDIMSLYEIEEHIGVLIREEPLPTEEQLNQERQEADKWLAEQRQKIPAAAPRAQNTRRRQTRPGQNTRQGPAKGPQTQNMGRTTPAPNAGRATSAPNAGRATSAPNAGRTTPVPNAGRTPPAPNAGRTTPAPNAGRATPAPNAGRTPPAPNAIRTTPVQADSARDTRHTSPRKPRYGNKEKRADSPAGFDHMKNTENKAAPMPRRAAGSFGNASAPGKPAQNRAPADRRGYDKNEARIGDSRHTSGGKREAPESRARQDGAVPKQSLIQRIAARMSRNKK